MVVTKAIAINVVKSVEGKTCRISASAGTDLAMILRANDIDTFFFFPQMI